VKPYGVRKKLQAEEEESLRKTTPHQLDLAERIARGQDPIEAAREVYEKKNLTEEGVKVVLAEAMDKPQVKRAIVRHLEAMNLSEANGAQKLYILLNKPCMKDADRLKALDLLFRLHGSFAPEKSVSVDLEAHFDVRAYTNVPTEAIEAEVAGLLAHPQKEEGVG
jgi:hypothetical protein